MRFLWRNFKIYWLPKPFPNSLRNHKGILGDLFVSILLIYFESICHRGIYLIINLTLHHHVEQQPDHDPIKKTITNGVGYSFQIRRIPGCEQEAKHGGIMGGRNELLADIYLFILKNYGPDRIADTIITQQTLNLIWKGMGVIPDEVKGTSLIGEINTPDRHI
jgi:hypothetical protein